MNRAPGKCSLILCEEALRDYNGHWFEYNRAVAAINRKEGVSVRVLAHRDLDDRVADELDAEPFFDCTNWDGIYYHISSWKRYLGVLHHNWRVWRKMSAFFRDLDDPVDCVFVPTVVIYHLVAWWFLSKRYGGTKVSRIVLLIRNSAATYTNDEIQFSPTARMLGFVLRCFRRLDRVVFSTDSHRLAEEYYQLADVSMAVLPHPCCLHGDSPGDAFDQSRDPAPIFISPGPARWEKGIHVLLKAMNGLDSDEVVCRIQWPDEVLTPEGERLPPFGRNCEFLLEPLSSDEYEQFLRGAGCIVLPYLREMYYARISGVAVEAMLLGIPVIYTDDTWVADMVSEYGAGLGFPSGDDEKLAECIQKIAAAPGSWREKAAAKRTAAHTHFSTDTFQQKLWGET